LQTKFNTRLGVRALTHAARTQVPRLTSVAAKMSGALSKISKKYNKKEIFSLKAVFDEADSDGSGEIDSSELRKALSKSSLSAAAVDMFKALDKDGSKRIGFDEYLKVRHLS
jgi:Ca2+-binding EF-hand superfamily protein